MCTRRVPKISLGQLLWSLFPFSDLYDEWMFNREVAARDDLESEDFYRRYYEGTGVPQRVVLGVLPIYSKFFGLPARKLRPHDWPPQIAEFDTEPLVRDIETEFGMSHAKWEEVDGSFDSVVRYVAAKILEIEPSQHEHVR